MAEKYYDWTPYNYVGSNPIKRVDLFGLDWYTDKDGSYQYDPKINNKTKLSDGQKYVGKTYEIKDENGNTKTNYRKDGSIFYSNQKDAFNRLDANSKKTGKEELAVMTEDGALVTPDYKNGSNDCNPVPRYGYEFKDGNIMDADGNTFETEATIHTHYNGDKEPSGTNGWGEGDLQALSRYTPNKPIMTMGADNRVYGVIGNYDKSDQLHWGWLPYSGKVQVSQIIQNNIVLKNLVEKYIYTVK